jgi:3D (Asp-Asp-Asp) domain-containing protein
MRHPALASVLFLATLGLPIHGSPTIQSATQKPTHPAPTPDAAAKQPTAPLSTTAWMKATITAYWPGAEEEPGCDYWTNHHTSSLNTHLREGVSVAVDPDIIPYGSQVHIKDIGDFIAQDTGSDVVNRTASHINNNDYPVIDLYFRTREAALAFTSCHGSVAFIWLQPPSTATAVANSTSVASLNEFIATSQRR